MKDFREEGGGDCMVLREKDMTKPSLTVDNSVVEALEEMHKILYLGFQDAPKLLRLSKERELYDLLQHIKKHLPIAKQQAEAEAALKWLVKNYPAALRGCLSSDCPPTIKEMLGEGK